MTSKLIIFKRSLGLILLLVGVAGFGMPARAASDSKVSLLATPTATGIGGFITLQVLANSERPINSIDVQISYPSDILSFEESDTAHSVVGFWKKGEPYLVSQGHLVLSGGMTQGFSGSGGQIAMLSFKVLEKGEATFSFERANAYIADGKGTRIAAEAEPIHVKVGEGAPGQGADRTAPLDTTPPIISAALSKDTLTGTIFVVFQATDPESGIGSVEMRSRKFMSWTPWQPVRNPAVYPSGARQIELRATNKTGLESSQVVSRITVAVGMILVPVCAIVAILAVILYNKRNKKKVNL